MVYCKWPEVVVAALSVLHSASVAQASERGGALTANNQTLGSSAEDIANQANALFAKSDDGVYFRAVKEDLSEIYEDKSSATTLSFSLLNKYAWPTFPITPRSL